LTIDLPAGTQDQAMLKNFPRVFSLAMILAAVAAPAVGADQTDWNARMKALLGTAVAFPTVAGRGEVPKMVEWLAGEFRNNGFSDKDITVLPMGETAAMVVRFRGNGSSGRKPMMFAAHLDVVGADPKDWTRDPFTMVEEDGFLFGRGVYDNKFAVASLATTFMRLKAEGFVPSRDLILVLTGDEETTGATAKALATQHRSLIDAEFALVADAGVGRLDTDGKPVSFTVQHAEKTYADFELTVSNPGGHSSQPRKDNAIYELAAALKAIEAYAFPVMSDDITRNYFKELGPLTGGSLGAAMTAFAKDPADKAAVAALRARPDLVGATGTTCIPTLLAGGHAVNALPQRASANINCRIFPGVGVARTLDTLKAVVGNDAIQWVVKDDPQEAPASPVNKQVMTAITDAVHAVYPGLPVFPEMESGGTDGVFFRAAGIPSYGLVGIFIRPEDSFRHGLNERVPLASVPIELEIWHRIITYLAGP
jgi:acetylornithine deacetylase/succinyl-diaminopimelate desuccinylase-like protein